MFYSLGRELATKKCYSDSSGPAVVRRGSFWLGGSAPVVIAVQSERLELLLLRGPL